MTAAFQPSRPDGRSDRRVVFELAEGADPDTTFTYDELIDALSDGLVGPVQRERVYRAVAAANRTLLRETKRHLQVVPDVGYRVARAADHVGAALVRKDRAAVQMARGVELLRNVKADELTESQRALNEGHLLIFAGLVQAIQESDRRHARSESLIADLQKRVDALEETQT